MKKINKKLLIAAILLCLISSLLTLTVVLKVGKSNYQKSKSEFSDKALFEEIYGKQSAVNQTINYENITSLEIENNTDIKGYGDLEKFPNLTRLKISGCKIDDFNFLNDLLVLNDLELTNCSLSDISGLADLSGLTKLNLSGNYIRDIVPLQKLTGLKELIISNNLIVQLPVEIQNLTALTSINLSGNQLMDVSQLEGLDNLQVLYLDSNYLREVNLGRLGELKELYVGKNPITSIDTLGELPELVSIELQYLNISDINFIEQYETIEEIDLSYSPVNDIGVLADLPELRALSMRHTGITDLTPLKGLQKFSEIYLDEKFDRSKIDFLQDHFRNGDYITKQYIIKNKYSLE